ncbi:DR2241 family protein [Deinococcus rubellus]|uniref:DR2241 family protein n=1 Tax=Deinococcus rubellus TaxID=1889240 RepID=A0ABY5YHF9_9DEIO|nr:DR2241 family protein [Deinococcus rubellus]UWX64361.1 DR2241 family protein [Deinococcus rubellus]
MRSLVLIGHGSHLNPESSAAVYAYADLLRQRGLFDEVVEGYWKEEPSLRQVLKTVRYTDVTVIPMFISEGYFTETVIPRELGLGHQGPVPPQGVARVIGGRTVRYTLPYGVHPRMSEVILARAREAYPAINADDTALIVLGHGTTRNENSSKIVHQNAERLREGGEFAEVHTFFLDQEPKVVGWRQQVKAKNVVLVPFFASEGWHTLETIPEDIGLTGEVTVFESDLEAEPGSQPDYAQTVYYSKPVGTHPAIAEVIIQLAEDAHGASAQGDVERGHQEAWNALLQLASDTLRLGEVIVRPVEGMFELRHALDEGKANEGLRTVVTPEGVGEQVRLDERGEYRPVHTLRSLARGWRAVLCERDLPRALHLLYPAVVEESYAHHHHALRCTPWAATARRQTGIYAKVQKATPQQVESVSNDVCGGCLKTRLWAGEALHQTFFSGVPGGIPCAEACTLLVAEMREEVTGKRGQGAVAAHD